jgi:DNA polymerase III subunit epsilon
MREIVFDTETTGFEPSEGHKIVEIGMIELIDLVPSGNHFHKYINPMRDMPIEAFKVHGLSAQFLSDFPTFGDPEICDAMLEFIGDSPLIAHNAEFDRKFLNAELSALKLPIIPFERCIDTLQIAKKMFPGAPVSLDALCRRFSIDLKDRSLHGALLDSKLLAAVYLELKGGRERSFGFDNVNDEISENGETNIAQHINKIGARNKILSPRIKDSEFLAHNEFIKSLGENAFWNKAH